MLKTKAFLVHLLALGVVIGEVVHLSNAGFETQVSWQGELQTSQGESVPSLLCLFEEGRCRASERCELGQRFAPPEGEHFAVVRQGDSVTQKVEKVRPDSVYTVRAWARGANQAWAPGTNPITATTIGKLAITLNGAVVASQELDVGAPVMKGVARPDIGCKRCHQDDGANVIIMGDYRMHVGNTILYQRTSADPIKDPWQWGGWNSWDGLANAPIATPQGLNAVVSTEYSDSGTLWSKMVLYKMRGSPPNRLSTERRGTVILQNSASNEQPWAIDAHLLYDPEEGRLWMSWGGHETWVSELDPETGRLCCSPRCGAGVGHCKTPEFSSHPRGVHTKILSWDDLSRPDNGFRGDGCSQRYMEGPALWKHEGMFYAFSSWGSMGLDYTIRVCRSRSVRGPFMDKLGRDCARFNRRYGYGSSMVLGPEGEQSVPGHPHIWQEQDGALYLGYDFRKGAPTKADGSEGSDFMAVRKLHFVGGWPTIWQPLEVSFSVPNAADEADVGIKLESVGAAGSVAAFDMVSLEVSGGSGGRTTVPTAPPSRPPSTSADGAHPAAPVILGLGDSIVQGSQQLVAAHCEGSAFLNAGVSGSRAEEWAAGAVACSEGEDAGSCSAARAFASTSSPSRKVWLAVGINDYLDSKCSLSSSVVGARVRGAIAAVRAAGPPGIEVLMMGYPAPSKRVNSRCTRQRLAKMQRAIGEAARHEPGVTFVDVFEGLGGSAASFSNSRYFEDSIHPNEEGYAKLFTLPEVQSFFGCGGGTGTLSPTQMPSVAEVGGATLLDENFAAAGVAGQNLGAWIVRDLGTTQRPSRWSIVEGGGAVQQLANTRTRESHRALAKQGTELVYADAMGWPQDYSLGLRLRSRDNDVLGVVLRRYDNENFIRFSLAGFQKDATRRRWSRSPTRRLMQMVAGVPTLLVGDHWRYRPRGPWMEVEIQAVGPTVRVYVDGKLVFEADAAPTESSSATAPTVALYSFANRGSFFSDVRVKALAALPKGPVYAPSDDPTVVLTTSRTVASDSALDAEEGDGVAFFSADDETEAADEVNAESLTGSDRTASKTGSNVLPAIAGGVGGLFVVAGVIGLVAWRRFRWRRGDESPPLRDTAAADKPEVC